MTGIPPFGFRLGLFGQRHLFVRSRIYEAIRKSRAKSDGVLAGDIFQREPTIIDVSVVCGYAAAPAALPSED